MKYIYIYIGVVFLIKSIGQIIVLEKRHYRQQQAWWTNGTYIAPRTLLISSGVVNGMHQGPCVIGLGAEGGTGPLLSETYSPPWTLGAALITCFPMWEGGEYRTGGPPAGISPLLATYCSLTSTASKVELDKDCFFLPSTSMFGFRGRASDL